MSLVEDMARVMCRRHANKDGVWFDDAALNKHIDNHSWAFKGYAADCLTVLKDRLSEDDRELVERLKAHIEQLDLNGADNTPRLSFDDLCALLERISVLSGGKE